ncbi:FAD-dependent oxidoreductase [Pedobacter sp. MC2016-14]|uniref:protoporphyrinogen/coproporphyrinogen oxidase n=1 Tax=Pedobacter sp. MC2016-14 TaxID=2897327 RepID=UPI001E304193|nr:FAD-dependent oxidoreductase [Pedobacter sp. MC2016-14]MCD0486946.1 FAD-dependent oxidoreductase [Pedobacter sp. MC2016-14]
MYTILGAGLSGISIADHLAKKNMPYVVIEAKAHGGGHIYSELVDGFVWDEGPHVSFTAHEYVKTWLEKNAEDQYLEYAPKPANYHQQSWIPHPAQANLYAIPQQLREQCIADLISVRDAFPADFSPKNYKEWIDYAFGETFANVFAAVYTKKYWTMEAEQLSTDWIGKRVYFPEVKDMVESAHGPLQKQTHYISTVRYPSHGGFYTYVKKIEKQLNIQYNKKLRFISFEKKELQFCDGSSGTYENLISTLPLPLLIANSDAPEHIKVQAKKLKCSQVLLINVVVNHPAPVDNHWIYVYDEQYYSTRINFTELLSPTNGVEGKSGIQVEVYFSDYHPLQRAVEDIECEVLNELVEMKLIRAAEDISSSHRKWIDWANVIFDTQRRAAQEQVLNWLESKGLAREADDLLPMTEWTEKAPQALGSIILAGRFAQWKYYWTDDCIMRGKYISEQLCLK